MHDYDPAAGDGDVDGPGDAALAAHPDFPELIDEVLYVRSSDLIGAEGLQQLCNVQKAGLQGRLQRIKLLIYDAVEGFDVPFLGANIAIMLSKVATGVIP